MLLFIYLLIKKNMKWQFSSKRIRLSKVGARLNTLQPYWRECIYSVDLWVENKEDQNIVNYEQI